MNARFALLAVVLVLGCTSNPYFIGAACPGALTPKKTGVPCGTPGAAGAGGGSSAEPGVTFAVDLDHSGASLLPASLELPSRTVPAILALRGEEATRLGWSSPLGAEFTTKMPAIPELGLAAPFTDGTGAVGLADNAPTFLAVSQGNGFLHASDFAIELVLRVANGVTVVDKRGSGVGWAVKVTPEGALVLELADTARSSLVTIASERLIVGAWYHCLFWVSRSAGGRADCNGRPGAPVDLSALGELEPASQGMSIGGTAPTPGDHVELASFTIFEAVNGNLGPAEGWADVSRQRFLALAGVSPRVALGSNLPRPGSRESAAYLDLEQGSARRLFLVGADWPRVVCRLDTAGERDCGYLSEPERTRWVPAEATSWAPSELTIGPNAASFADGAQRMAALIPSARAAAHALTWSGSYGGSRQALSFFARAEAGRFVAASVSNREAVVFDLSAGAVVSAAPNVRASIEPWGDGIFRCAYIFQPDPGGTTYRVEPVTGPMLAPFAGDGALAWLDIAGLQLDVGTANPGSLLAADPQAADALSFLGNDGNVPSSTAVSQALRVLLPPGARLTDQALLSLDLAGQFGDQVELYVTGDTGQLKFWGLRGGDTHFAFNHPASFVDGLRHGITAGWDTAVATLAVDGVVVSEDALIPNDPPFTADRIDIGFSASGSGSLEGLVAGLEIAETAH